MMTTSMNSVNLVQLPPQMTQPIQSTVRGQTAAEELKAEDQRQTERVSMPTVSLGNPPIDVRLFGIRQAADVGLLRPIWLEMMEMLNVDMPRINDLLEQAVKSDNEEAGRIADETEHIEESGLAPTDRTGLPGGESNGAAVETIASDGKSGLASTGRTGLPGGESNGAAVETIASDGKSGIAATYGAGQAAVASK